MQAVRDGIVDHRTGQYINPATRESCPIGEAMNDGRIRIERVVTTRSAEERRSVGLITIRVQTDTREYAIKGAVDLATGQTLTADEVKPLECTLHIFHGENNLNPRLQIERLQNYVISIFEVFKYRK